MFNTNALSTLDTIAQHEKEINEQAGYTQRWGLRGGAISDTENIEITLPVGTTSVLYETPSGWKSDSHVGLEIWALPIDDILSFEALDASMAIVDVFQCNEGQGLILKGESSTASLSHEQAWHMIEASRTWQDKIDLAKTMLVNDIEAALNQRGYSTNEIGGTPLISIVTNADTFRIACDYLALSLIYSDLSNGGFNELFRRKTDYYSASYNAELTKALQRMQLDPALTGKPTENRPSFTGTISR